MAKIVIVGDGPGGLSAALFLSKNGHQTVVYGLDETAMHFAFLHNYPGVPDTSGDALQATAREQATRFGTTLVSERVRAVSVSEAGVAVTTDSGTEPGDYLVLSEGKNPVLADSLGLRRRDDGAVWVDDECRSSLDRVYVVGRSIRPRRSQAIISAGDGAKAALDILAREAGSDTQDWDTPPKGD
jgi:thioredoxin reductase